MDRALQERQEVCPHCKYKFLGCYTLTEINTEEFSLQCPACWKHFELPTYRLAWRRDSFNGMLYSTLVKRYEKADDDFKHS